MKKQYLFILNFLGFLIPFSGIAQTANYSSTTRFTNTQQSPPVKPNPCDCETTFNWVKKTMEENDAGYPSVIQKKGTDSYQDHVKSTLTKIKNASLKTPLSGLACEDIIYDYMRYFRNGHIAINYIPEADPNFKNTADTKTSTPAPATSPAPSLTPTPIYKINVPDFLNYIAKKQSPDLEGIWQTGAYKIGIKKDGNQYIGFILETEVENWKPGMIKLKIQADTLQKLSGNFYLRDFSELNPPQIIQIGHNWINFGSVDLFRVNSPFPEKPEVELYLKGIRNNKPFLERLNANTLYLRIPSFSHTHKQAIDSVIKTHRELILSTENLIIDIKNGTGGSDNSYKEIIPLIYTNPIRSIGVEFYSTKLNNSRMQEMLKATDYGFTDEQKKWMQESYTKLEQQLGKFVNLHGKDIIVEKLDTIYNYPKNVAILVNEANGSTDEQFLLAAKQSRKVKIFGRRTQGVLDISNMHFVKSPCNHFELGYAISKSKRLPYFPIDDIGIQPDYFFDEKIPDYEWISYINDILNGNYNPKYL